VSVGIDLVDSSRSIKCSLSFQQSDGEYQVGEVNQHVVNAEYRWKDAEKDCTNALSRDAKNAKVNQSPSFAKERHFGGEQLRGDS
jgi:hypothetical protein